MRNGSSCAAIRKLGKASSSRCVPSSICVTLSGTIMKSLTAPDIRTGLKAEEISPLVRILSVADVYDALTTERPYRPKKSKQEAISILRSMKNHLDQDIVNILVESLEEEEELT